MSYIKECQLLVEETQTKTYNAIKKYNGKHTAGQLDGEPWDNEVREITKEFNERLKDLQNKYPNWREEIN